MADIDLKAATPDTSLPSTGFLFGADSQSATAPSVYSTQTVATALLGSTGLTGGTVTTSTPVLDMAQTWNAGAVAFTGWKLNVTDTASASGSLLMDLQVGGASQLRVSKSGIASAGYGFLASCAGGIGNTFIDVGVTRAGVTFWSGGSIVWSSSTTVSGSVDLFLTRRAAANLRLGSADVAAPVAQTLSVQSVVAGTTDTAGANLTITGSQGTGTGAGGSIVFQVAPAGATGTAQNALATALTIDAERQVTFSGGAFVDRFGSIASKGSSAGFYVKNSGGNNTGRWLENAGIQLASDHTIAFANGSTVGTADTILARDDANTLALRNGANAQAFNVYNTFTDASNYERGFFKWNANVLEIGAEHLGTGVARSVKLWLDSGKVASLTCNTAGNSVSLTSLYGVELTTSNMGIIFPRGFALDTEGRGLRVATTSAAAAPTNTTANNVGDSLFRMGYGYGPQPIGGSFKFLAGYGATPTAAGAGGAGGSLRVWVGQGGLANGAFDNGTDGALQVLTVDRSGTIATTPVFQVSYSGFVSIGGTTSSFPALKRSSTTLQARLADDSAFASVQGKLTTDTNAVAETPTATHTITIYDAAGTAYKVLCVAA